MKTTKLINTLRTSAIMIGMLITMGILTSCEKAEDDFVPTSDPVYTNIVNEVVIVEAADWQTNQVCSEATLDCAILTNAVEYEFLKVYIKVPKTASNPEIWEELPVSDLKFRINNFKICVKRTNNGICERSTFLVEMKLKENPSIKRSEENLNGQYPSTL